MLLNTVDKSRFNPIWQGDKRWTNIKLGFVNEKGPTAGTQSDVGEAGCVLSALMQAVNLALGKSYNPGTLNTFLQGVEGAFVDGHGGRGDELYLPVACEALGLECGAAIVGLKEIQEVMTDKLAMVKGAVFTRLAVDDTLLGKHTTLAVINAGGEIECLDSACPGQKGTAEGWSVLPFNTLGVDVMWNKTPKKYQVVCARAVWAP